MEDARKSRGPLLSLALGILLLASPAARAAEVPREAPPQARTRTKDLSRALTVDGRTVVIRGQGMDLRVEAVRGDAPSMTATLEYWADNDEWMKAVAERYDVTIRERPDRLEIDFGDLPERGGGNWLRRLFGNGNYSWSLDVHVTVPAGTALEIENRYGPVEVRDVGGALTLVNSSGEVTVAGSGAATIENTYASVAVEDARGPLSIRGGSAEVTVDRAAAGVDAVTSYAALRIRDVTGDVEAEASSGALEVLRVEGDVRTRNTYAEAVIEDVGGALDHETSSGEVRVRGVAGRVRAVGSYGSMTLERVGPAEIRNGSGAVTATGVGGDLTVANSYAPVRIRDVAGTVRVDSSSAGVEIEDVDGGVEVTTSYDGVRIRGVGGPVRVRNGSGRVTVEGFRDAALGAAHDIETSYAGIEIVWPGSAENIAIEAQCTYGSIHSELGGAVDASGSRQTLSREGSGGASLRLVASSGSIRILRH